MIIFTRRPGRPGRVRFMPGCLVGSLLVSIALTLLVNAIAHLS
jgi:hypothetical protein